LKEAQKEIGIGGPRGKSSTEKPTAPTTPTEPTEPRKKL